MEAVYIELGLIALAAMLSPTTLSFSILALVLSKRPRSTGFWFFLGAFAVTMIIGVIAAFVLGNAAASPKSNTPKTPVAIIDVIAGVLALVFVVRLFRRPADPQRVAGTIDKMSKVASSPWIAIVAAGASLANPGAFIPLALKSISETNPNAAQYMLLWLAFTVVSLLPLLAAIVMLLVSPDRALRVLHGARAWLERNAMRVAAAILFLLAISLLRNGIAGLTS
ncbi:MAG: GAP family protein [Solirubrobacteraceae bacterium]